MLPAKVRSGFAVVKIKEPPGRVLQGVFCVDKPVLWACHLSP